MADAKKGGLYAAVFAAGMAAGGGGVESLRDPDPTSYIAAGVVEAVENKCSGVVDLEPCESLRKWQISKLVDDLAEDVVPSEEVPLGEVEEYIAARLTYDDEGWEIFAQDVLAAMTRRLADGYAAKDIAPEDTIPADALVAMLEAASDA